MISIFVRISSDSSGGRIFRSRDQGEVTRGRHFDPVAAIDNSCVGCGNCGEVADAAVLCPSFFRADVVHNPSAFDKWRQRLTLKFIGWLQQRRERAGVAA